MGFNVLRAVMDLVENPPAVNPYTALKGCLVLAHQLTPVQKAIRCLQVTASSSQRPSDVLASLLEFCPPGEKHTALFRGAFTMRLPVAIQAHLAGTELTDIKELAQMTDRLWLCHGPMPVSAVEELQSDNGDVVAAIPNKKQWQKKRGGHSRGHQGSGGSSSGGSSGRSRGSGSGNKSREVKNIFYIHKKYGKKAHYCADESSCTWSGN